MKRSDKVKIDYRLNGYSINAKECIWDYDNHSLEGEWEVSDVNECMLSLYGDLFWYLQKNGNVEKVKKCIEVLKEVD